MQECRSNLEERDSVNPKYVIEAGTSHSPATPITSLSSSLAGQSVTNTMASNIDEDLPPIAGSRYKWGLAGKKEKNQLGNKENELDQMMMTMPQQMMRN